MLPFTAVADVAAQIGVFQDLLPPSDITCLCLPQSLPCGPLASPTLSGLPASRLFGRSVSLSMCLLTARCKPDKGPCLEHKRLDSSGQTGCVHAAVLALHPESWAVLTETVAEQH